MPYTRVGKKVYKRENGKYRLVGESETIEKARAHVRALYANTSKEKKNDET